MRAHFLAIDLHLGGEVKRLVILARDRRAIEMPPPGLGLLFDINERDLEHSNDVIAEHVVAVTDLQVDVFGFGRHGCTDA